MDDVLDRILWKLRIIANNGNDLIVKNILEAIQNRWKTEDIDGTPLVETEEKRKAISKLRSGNTCDGFNHKELTYAILHGISEWHPLFWRG